MDKVFLYARGLTAVSFLLFNDAYELDETVAGVQNEDNENVWECAIPGTVPAGNYTVIAESGSKVIGEERVYWTGDSVIEQQKQLAEVHKIHGLDPSCDLVVSSGQRTAGAGITQTLTIESGSTTVSRA